LQSGQKTGRKKPGGQGVPAGKGWDKLKPSLKERGPKTGKRKRQGKRGGFLGKTNGLKTRRPNMPALKRASNDRIPLGCAKGKRVGESCFVKGVVSKTNSQIHSRLTWDGLCWDNYLQGMWVEGWVRGLNRGVEGVEGGRGHVLRGHRRAAGCRRELGKERMSRRDNALRTRRVD